jgi:hypothetical protein
MMFDWFRRNGYEISWFVIGWLAFACLNEIGKGNYVWAAIDAILVLINYQMVSRS